MATCSAIEFLHSFRDTVDSDTPSYTSKNALRAFEKLKEIKEKISTGTLIKKFYITKFFKRKIINYFFILYI